MKVNPFILYLSEDKQKLRNLSLYFGVEGVYSEKLSSYDHAVKTALNYLKLRGVEKQGKILVYNNLLEGEKLAIL